MKEIKLTKENFNSEVVNSDKPVLIDFWATWCGPCQMIAPVIEEIANENESIKVCKVNVDEQPELASAFKVASIPTIVVVKEGKVANTAVGFMSKQRVLELIES
ncbi:MAG: thioredoxin [Eubacteriales bacterium]|nr:thioredoxin [Eubacteriales bacterium]